MRPWSSGQDIGFSARGPGFDSPWAYQQLFAAGLLIDRGSRGFPQAAQTFCAAFFTFAASGGEMRDDSVGQPRHSDQREVGRVTLRPALICIALTLLASLAAAYDDPVADYLATRERLVPAAVSSRIALQQVLATGDFDHVEVTGDVSGKASAAPSLDGHPMRTLMLTLDDGWSLALKAGEEIDPLQVGHRVAVIARPAGGTGLNDLLLEAWAYDWDLPHEEEGMDDPPAEAPLAPPVQPAVPVVPAPAGAPPTVRAAPIVPPSPDAGLDCVIAV